MNVFDYKPWANWGKELSKFCQVCPPPIVLKNITGTSYYVEIEIKSVVGVLLRLLIENNFEISYSPMKISSIAILTFEKFVRFCLDSVDLRNFLLFNVNFVITFFDRFILKMN